MRRSLSLVAVVPAGAVVATFLTVLAPGVAAAAVPAGVTGLTATPGEGQVALTWVDPTPAPGQVIVREAQGAVPPASPSAGVPVALTSATTATAAGLAYGSAYSFSVFTVTGGAVSAPVSVTSAPVAATTIGIGVAPSTVTYGGKTVVSGRLRRAIDQAPVAGEKITLYERATGSTTWKGWLAATTDANGVVSFPVKFGRATQFELVHAAGTFYGATSSKTAGLNVAPKVTITAPALAKTFAKVTVVGHLKPAIAGQTVYLQKYAGGWKTVLATKTRTSGAFLFTLSPTTPVTYSLRAYLPKAKGRPAELSGKIAVTVGKRDLSQGMTGPDVLALQKRLEALHYDIGAVNGSYSFDTAHAVVAFEKVQGLTRDGVVTDKVRTALAKPKVPAVRFHDSGLSVEVNKTLQVLLLVRDGVLWKILDTSTGFGGDYTYAGVTYQAYTPEGTFHIQRKISGVRVSHLGVLIDPSYFFQGWAIHGEGEVPAYPASHGCVRITVPAVNRYYNLLTVGTTVHIYH